MIKYAVIFTLIGVTLAVSEAHGDSQISDSFKTSGRSEQPLDGAKAESGNATWEATSNLIIKSGSESGVAVNDSAYFIGKVPISGSQTKGIELEASVRLSKVSGTNPWFAIGLGNPGRKNNSWGGGFFLLLHKDGQWAGFFNPNPEKRETISRLSGGRAVDFDGEGTNSLKIDYDKTKNQVSMWVNGAKVIDDYDLSQHDFQPDLAYAGFSGSDGQLSDIVGLEDIKVSLKD